MRLKRVGIIGDVHAEATRLEAALHFLHTAQVERILCVGDIVDGPGSVDRCCELLQQAQVEVVRGNHDRWFVHNTMRDLPQATQWEDISDASRAYITSLPATKTFETVAGRLLLCHGMGDNDMQRLTPDDYGYALEFKDELHDLIRNRDFTFVVSGHTHRRMVRRFDHLTVINAGTLYNSHEPCITIANFEAGAVQFYDFQDKMLVSSGEPIHFAGS
jgi:putative phosphoesterase